MMHEDTKEHISRFVTKLAIAALIAGIVKRDNYLLSFSFWISLYAAFAVLYAILKHERFSFDRFSYWDEAMWLGLIAFILRFAGKTVSVS